MENAGTDLGRSHAEEKARREEEATSKETLEELKDQEKTSESGVTRQNPPSPDGAFDQSNEVKDADPM